MNKLLKPVAVYFIEGGRYEVTQKAYDELAPAREPIESATRYSLRGKEDGADTRAAKRRVELEVGRRISAGGAAKLYDLEYVAAEPSWVLPEDRLLAIRALVESGIKPRQVTKKDFLKSGLRGVITHYEESPYLALKAAGLANFEPWEMDKAPNGTFTEKENRVRAVRWLVKKLGKEPGEVSREDFYDNCLGGMLDSYYGESPYRALKDAGLAEGLQNTDNAPRRTFSGPEMRIKAIRGLVKSLGKNPRQVTHRDFEDSGLGGLLDKRYRDSPYLALKAAGLADFEPWEMGRAPNHTFSKRSERIRAVWWLVRKLGKEPGEITGDDFKENGLGGLLANHLRGSPYYALKEAGFVTSPREMRNEPKTIKR